MGTRASFFIGDPTNLDQREWLGCIAWDGYPGSFSAWAEPRTEAEFRADVATLASERNDFATPTRGFPFPWADDLFLTDYTYAYFDGAVQTCCFHQSFMTVAAYLAQDEDAEQLYDDPHHVKVPAPAAYDRSQPDSIMIIEF